MLSLQLYFLYATYQGEKEELIKDINASFELVLPVAQEARLDEAHRLHVQDISNPELLEVEWKTDDPTKTAFEVKDPVTGKSVLTYSFGKDPDRDTVEVARDMFYNLLIKRERKDRIYFGLTEEVDRRRDLYWDTVSLNLDLLKDTLDQKLLALNIPTNYQFEEVHSDVQLKDSGNSLYSKRLDAYKRSDYDLLVVFDNPLSIILARMPYVLAAAVIVLLLIGISFFALFKTINRQRKLSSLKDDFIDSMTHELLTPIATLKISLETLENEKVRTDHERAAKYLNISKMELSRVSDIVHNVLYSSLHEQKEAKLKIERLNVNELLDDLVNYHSNSHEGGVDIQFQPLEDPWVSTDRQHFTNVLHNLIDNGIKYANGQAQISIVPTRNARELSIVVNDNGCGIAESEQARVFDKFYRAQAVQDIKGLGVGLYYVKSILARLRGDVELLHSSPKGSSFRVSLNTSLTSE